MATEPPLIDGTSAAALTTAIVTARAMSKRCGAGMVGSPVGMGKR